MSNGRDVLSLPAKTRLALKIVLSFVAVRARIRREPLPSLVARLAERSGPARRHHAPERLSRAVDRTLRFSSRQPTCLVSSLVLFRMLREQGYDAELVLGLPEEARDHEAHAWVEIDGRDVGPPPGRGTHAVLARFS
jgi:hypothetical protein